MLTARFIPLMLCTYLTHALPTTAPPPCRDPEDEELAAILRDYTDSYNESWNYTSPDDEGFWDRHRDFPQLDADETLTCQSLPDKTEEKFIRRSTCPGIHKTYLNAEMYPRETAVVVCCNDKTALCGNNSHCEKVRVPEPRLWKTKEVQGNNTCVWRGFQYERSVACACALDRSTQG